jgi:hypothetical protein
MEVSGKIEIRPFPVQDEFHYRVQFQLPKKKCVPWSDKDIEVETGCWDSMPTADLPDEDLAQLCKEFVESVFTKAGKSQPTVDITLETN